MFDQRYEAIGKGVDEPTGLRMVLVARIKSDTEERLTVWKIVYRPGKGWYSVAQWISKGQWRRFPEKYGVKLSDSKTDQALLHHASTA